MMDWRPRALDWVIAWRHIRVGEDRPAWVRPLFLGALYLILLGAAFAFHATTLGAPEVSAVDAFGIEDKLGPTPLQRYFGAFGGITLAMGIMVLLFAALSWTFNLLATIITMSVLLGCMALVVVLSLMSGLEGDLRDKILGQKAHVKVSRVDARPFADYLELADAVSEAVSQGNV